MPPGPVKPAPAQVRPPSPGNIRPIKREVRVEPERKDPEKEPQKVANEPSLKGKALLVKVEEATVEEGTPVEPEAAPGRNPLTRGGVWVACCLYSLFLFLLHCFDLAFSFFLFFPCWALENFTLRLIWGTFLEYNFPTYKERIIHPTAYGQSHSILIQVWFMSPFIGRVQ